MQQVNGQCLLFSATSLAILLHFALSVYLFVTDRYIDLTARDWDASCGLRGLSKDDVYTSYEDYRQKCSPGTDPLCGYIPSLQSGGLALFCLLCLSTSLEAANLAQAWATRFLLSKSIRALLQDSGKVPAYVQVCSRLFQFALLTAMFDPIVLLTGIVVWTVSGDLGSLGGEFHVAAGAGLVVFTVKTALATAVSAVQLTSLLSARRNNQALLAVRHSDGAKVSSTQVVSTLEAS